jgi:hypothetical protein
VGCDVTVGVPPGPAAVVMMVAGGSVVIEVLVVRAVGVGSLVVELLLVELLAVEELLDRVLVTVTVLVLFVVVVEVPEKKFCSSEHKDHVLQASATQQPANPGCPANSHVHHFLPVGQVSTFI